MSLTLRSHQHITLYSDAVYRNSWLPKASVCLILSYICCYFFPPQGGAALPHPSVLRLASTFRNVFRLIGAQGGRDSAELSQEKILCVCLVDWRTAKLDVLLFRSQLFFASQAESKYLFGAQIQGLRSSWTMWYRRWGFHRLSVFMGKFYCTYPPLCITMWYDNCQGEETVQTQTMRLQGQ